MLVKVFVNFIYCKKIQFHTFTFVVILLIFLYFIISYPSRYLNFMSIRYLYLLINSCNTITHIVLMICKFLVRPWRKAEWGRGSAYEVNSYWWCFQYGWKSCTSQVCMVNEYKFTLIGWLILTPVQRCLWN